MQMRKVAREIHSSRNVVKNHANYASESSLCNFNVLLNEKSIFSYLQHEKLLDLPISKNSSLYL